MSKEVLAVVAGVEITEADLDAFLQNVPKEQQMYVSNPQFRKQYLDQMIALRLFAKMGEDAKLDETEEFHNIMKNVRADILAQMAMTEVLKQITVTEEEAKAFYEANLSQFEKGATVSAKHILTETEEQCTEAFNAIVSGEKTFEDAAKACSTCPSSANGGDLGTFGRGQMVKEFEDAAFEAEIGHVVGPVKTQFGYHLIKVEAKTEAKVAAYEEVEAQIKGNLMQQKQAEAYNAKIEELKGKYMA